jgi:hypothetical protein
MKNAADVPAFAPSLWATTSPLPTAGGAPRNAYNAYANPVKKENKSGLPPSGYRDGALRLMFGTPAARRPYLFNDLL